VGQSHVAGVYAQGNKPVLLGLFAKMQNIVFRGLCFQQCVINTVRNFGKRDLTGVGGHVDCSLSVRCCVPNPAVAVRFEKKIVPLMFLGCSFL
jgi:hypothetical protein